MDTHKSLSDSNGGSQKRRGRGGCCSAFRAFHVYGNRVSLYTLTHSCFFFPSLLSASKIKPGCTMNIVSLLLLVFNFQTVGGKCTDNKCSLHARSLPWAGAAATQVSQKLSRHRISKQHNSPSELKGPAPCSLSSGRAACLLPLQPRWGGLCGTSGAVLLSLQELGGKGLFRIVCRNTSLLVPLLRVPRWIWLLLWYFFSNCCFTSLMQNRIWKYFSFWNWVEAHEVLTRYTYWVRRSGRSQWLGFYNKIVIKTESDFGVCIFNLEL